MSSLKEIKSRIASVRNTQKITSAMRMVASAKLHHTQGMTEAFLRYKDELGKIVNNLQLTVDSSMRQEDQQGENQLSTVNSQLSTVNSQLSTLIVPVSSNSGLCGAFNSNIAKATMQRVQELESQGTQVRLLPIGKKITNELKKANKEFNADFVLLLEKIEKSNTFTDVSALVELANEWYQAQEINNVEFIYHHFKSMGSQVIQIDNLPLTPHTSPLSPHPSHLTPHTSPLTPLTEPSLQELLTSLFPRLLNAQVYGILLDSLTSEHAARMLAMQTADENANELLKELTLVYNKTRQQAITNELIDIMGGQSGKH